MLDFVHLHVHTDYSLLDGAAQIKPLVARAKELGMKALAITDHGNMFGVLHFQKECFKQGIKPIIGCEFYVAGGSRTEKSGTEQGNKYYHLILLAKNETGYRNLVMLSSRSYTEGFYYKPRIDSELLTQYADGLVCLSACIAGELPQLLLAGDTERAIEMVNRYKALFGEKNYFIELQDHGLAEQRTVAPRLIEVAQKTNTPMVVTNDSHYILPEDWEAQEIMMCISTQKTLSDPKHMTFGGSKEFYLKNADEMARLFPNYPEMITNSVRIADMCNCKIPQFDVSQLKDCLPEYQIPAEFATDEAYMRHLVDAGLQKRYGSLNAQITERVEYEMGIITSMGFVGYFLIVWDFINWAREHDIPIGPGRGSGAGSIVAYAMGITNIDPLRFKLFFERFLNPERISMPDFDIDISNEGRQDVIKYTRQKYGDSQVGHIITFGSLKAKAVIKDVGRVLEIPLDEVNMLTKLAPDVPKSTLDDCFSINPKVQGSGQLAAYRDDPRYKRLFDICYKLENANRNTSLHASGIVIGKSALPEWAPVFVEKKTGKIATQYTMDIIEPCGLVKMDYLGLKALSILKRAERLIRKKPGFEQFDLEKIDEHDEKAFDLFCAGKTAAFFQFESSGMQNVLRRAKPRQIEDIIALNALYRPGPMDYIDPFIAGKFDHSTIKYPDPCLKDILEETYGVMVYQEQVMQVAQRIAGYSLGQADVLRRAMGKKKTDVMVKEKEKFIAGAIKNGFDAAHAGDIFEIMLPFADYGFNKSHAAAYSIIAYQTAFLKANFPKEFVAANLTNEISSADNKLSQYIEEGRGMGIEITPPDINYSGSIFEVVEGKIVFGLLGIKGLGEAASEEILLRREEGGAFASFIDFLERVDLHTVNKKALEVLIKTGSFDSLGQTRATLLLNVEKAAAYAENKKLDSKCGQASLFGDTEEKIFSDFIFEAAEDWPLSEKLAVEKELIGCYISGHPLDAYRQIINERATTTTEKINLMKASAPSKPPASGEKFDWKQRQKERQEKPKHTIIGIVKELREINTKKGDQMAFAVLEDLSGTIELVFFSRSWEQIKPRLHADMITALYGVIDTERGEKATFQVEELLDVQNLPVQNVLQKPNRNIHIKLSTCFTQESQLLPLRDFLFGASGHCTVYFHITFGETTVTVKAGIGMTAPDDNEFITELEDNPFVESVWKD